MKQHKRSGISTRVAADGGAERVDRDDNRFNAATVSPNVQKPLSPHMVNMEGGRGEQGDTSNLFLTRHNDVKCMGVSKQEKSESCYRK